MNQRRFPGFPPVIYLLLNKTIRTDCKKAFNKMFGPIGSQVFSRSNGISPMTATAAGTNKNKAISMGGNSVAAQTAAAAAIIDQFNMVDAP
jgi:hypothetical protein